MHVTGIAFFFKSVVVITVVGLCLLGCMSTKVVLKYLNESLKCSHL